MSIEELQIEIDHLAKENKNMAEYLLCLGTTREQIDAVCRGDWRKYPIGSNMGAMGTAYASS